MDKDKEFGRCEPKDIPESYDHQTGGGKYRPNRIERGYTMVEVTPEMMDFEWPMRYRGPW